MKYILKFKWPVTVLMILFAAVTFLISPNLTQLATEKGDVQLSDEHPSEQARVFLEEYGEDNEMMSLVLEFGDKVSENESDINDYIEEIDSIDGVDNVVNPFDFAEEMQTNFINDENAVIMIRIEDTGPVNDIGNVAAEVEHLNSTDATTSTTSNELIPTPAEQDAIGGLQSTELFTVIIVIAVLLIIF